LIPAEVAREILALWLDTPSLAAVINAALTKLRLSKTATGLPELVSFL